MPVVKFPFLFLILLFSSLAAKAASPSQTIEQLTIQVAPLWKTMRPVCVMGQDIKLQPAIRHRLEFLDSRLVANKVSKQVQTLLAKPPVDPAAPKMNKKGWRKAWSDQVWSLREQLERVALKPEERENLREYFFKLQTQTPNAERTALVNKIQYMSETLNLSLRQELWKTCHGLGLAVMPAEQMEQAVSQRWLKQSEKVEMQLSKELAAFYFYSLRHVRNPELAIIADVSAKLDGWVELASLAIQNHFANLRAQMVAIPFVVPEQVIPSTDGPFAEDRLWNPAPSQGLPQL